MKQIRSLCLSALTAMVAVVASPSSAQEHNELSAPQEFAGFELLFDGRSLDGWTTIEGPMSSWTVKDGCIVALPGQYVWLRTEGQYTDFELFVEFYLMPEANSGVSLRCAPEGEAAFSGMELQIFDDFGNEPSDTKCGAVYNAIAPDFMAIKRAPSWNTYHIKLVGDRLDAWLNGVQIHDGAKLDDRGYMHDPNAKHPLNGRLKSGHIALQNHGQEIRFRNVKIRDLSPKKRAARRGEPLRVFYCTHSAGFEHGVLPESRKVMAELGEDNRWLDMTISNQIGDLTPERLAKTDVVVFYTSGPLPMGEMKGELLAWIRGGGALVGIHSATDTLKEDPAYVKLIGGIFDGHPWNEDVVVIVEDDEHPAAKPFLKGAEVEDGVARFHIADEIYQHHTLNKDMHVIVRLDPANPKTEDGRAYPLAWTLRSGKGRVFYTAFGHRPEVWHDARFQQHLLAGIRWAAGLVGASDTPNPTNPGVIQASD
jgi:type 1 glutamine amidotransferase